MERYFEFCHREGSTAVIFLSLSKKAHKSKQEAYERLKMKETRATMQPRRSAENSVDAEASFEEEIRKLLPCPPGWDGKPVVICLDFGIDPDEAKKKNPGMHYCYGCGLFLQEFPIASAGRKKSMRPNKSAYRCTANHASLEQPTKTKAHHSILGDEDRDEVDY